MTHTPAPAGSRAVASTIGSDAPGSATARGMVLAIAAAALAVVSVLPPLVMPVLLGLLMVLFAWGWPQLLGVPSPGGSAIVIALVGLGALVGTTVLGSARPIVPAIGIGVLAAFLQQMMRKEGRPRLTDAISGTVSGLVIAASGAGWVVLESLGGGREALLVASAAMSAGALAHFLPAPRPVVLGGIMVTAALVGLGWVVIGHAVMLLSRAWTAVVGSEWRTRVSPTSSTGSPRVNAGRASAMMPRIWSVSNALTTRMLAAAAGPSSPPVLANWLPRASVHASAAALAEA